MTTLPLTVAWPPSTPMRLRRRFTVASITTTSPGCTDAAEADALHAAEENQLILVLGLRENQDGPDLGHRFRQDGWRQRRPPAAGRPRQIRLVQRHVLDADDPLIRLEFRDPVDQQERIPVRKNAFDCRIVQRKRQIHEVRCEISSLEASEGTVYFLHSGGTCHAQIRSRCGAGFLGESMHRLNPNGPRRLTMCSTSRRFRARRFRPTDAR